MPLRDNGDGTLTYWGDCGEEHTVGYEPKLVEDVLIPLLFASSATFAISCIICHYCL